MKQYLKPMWLLSLAGVMLLIIFLVAFIWSFEPDTVDIRRHTQQVAEQQQEDIVVGYTMTTALIMVSETLLDKSGGYLSNDVMPPGVMLDNMPSWEFGALEMIRDLSLSMRRDFSRSQSQSTEHPQLIIAQPKLNFDHRRWILPSTESQYRDAIEALELYRTQLTQRQQQQAQFYARADNLTDWLGLVEKRLGSLSQKLSASVGQQRLNSDLAGDPNALQSTPNQLQPYVKTSWWKIDNNFYEARGATWALLHFLKAAEIEFQSVLENKNATVSLQQIIRELEASQQTLWSPVILNGGGFGMMANHSLVMANYISRANAALIDLQALLNRG